MTIDDSVQLLSRRFPQFPQSVNYDVDNKGNDFCEVCLQNGKNPMFPVTITVKEAGCLISVGRVQNVTGTACVPVEDIIPAIEDIVNGRVIFVFGYANDEKLQDDTTGDSNIVASAKFKAYWKIISGYSLRILLLANGKLTGEDGAKTVTVHYSISRDGSAILGYRSDTDSIGDEAEIGNYSPDYTNQVFSTVGSSEFEIVTVSESLDVWSGGVANGELTTVISLRVEVLN